MIGPGLIATNGEGIRPGSERAGVLCPPCPTATIGGIRTTVITPSEASSATAAINAAGLLDQPDQRDLR